MSAPPEPPQAQRTGRLGEPRWPMALAVLTTGLLRAALPHQLRNGDAAWLFLVLVVVLLAILIIGDPGRIDRDRPWLHNLTSVLIGLISIANADAAIRLVVGIVNVSSFTQDAKVLLASGGAIWLSNIIAFALWYWNLDRGGPAARAAGTDDPPALIFPEMLHPQHVKAGLDPDLRGLLPLRLRDRHRLQPDRRVGRQALDEAHDDGRGGHLLGGGDPRRRPRRQHLEVAPPARRDAGRTQAGRAGTRRDAPGRHRNHDGSMHLGGRTAVAGPVAIVAVCVLSSCGSSPTAEQKNAGHTAVSTTTVAPTSSTSTTTPSSTTTPGVTVPNVIGAKIAAAHAALRAVGLPSVPLNTPCNKGSLASQSVVSSLAIPGTAPDLRVGAVPLPPGAVVPPGTRIGITWSGCYGDTATVPAVVGLTFAAARHALHAVGLTWACYSVGKETTTTTTRARTTTTSDSSTSSSAAPVTTAPTPVTTTTVKPRPTVLTQTPGAGTVLHPGTPVSLTMHICPQ